MRHFSSTGKYLKKQCYDKIIIYSKERFQKLFAKQIPYELSSELGGMLLQSKTLTPIQKNIHADLNSPPC